MLNQTVLGSSGSADVQVYPSDEPPRVRTRNTNATRGRISAVAVQATLSPDGSVMISASQGSLDVIVDVVGYFSAAGSRFIATTPQRIDDRAPISGGRETVLAIGGQAGVPSDASAVMLNLTGVGADRAIDLQVSPAGQQPVHRTSNVNLLPGQAVPNLVLAGLDDRSIGISGSGTGSARVILDQLGYFTAD